MKHPADAFQPYRDKARSFVGAQYTSKRRRRDPVDPSVDPYSLPLDNFDVAVPELFKQDLVGPWFERLRDEAPVHFCPQSQFGPYWSITRFDDILAVDSDHARFSSDASHGGVLISGTPQTADFMPMFIQMDPPRHDQQRMAVAPRFGPGKLAELTELIRARAIGILEDLPRGETFDWVEHVSKDLTGQMLATLLGVPLEERDRLIRWSDIVSNADNPEIVPSPDLFYDTLADMGEYFSALWNERSSERGHGEPGIDLVSMLAHGEGTRDMSPQELVGNMALLITGGNDTTRNSISGGLLALNTHADEYAKLRANPALVANMVPEIIRWQTPLAHMARTATEDVVLHGQLIRKGDRVVLWYLSGNRDPRVIDDPEAFRIERPNARHHLSFGFGIHRCLGNRLAEMQLRVLWEEIMRRFPRIELDGTPVRVNSCMFHGFSSMPVRIPH